MFDITGDDIARLNDADLRTLVAPLAIAELSKQDAPVSAATRMRPTVGWMFGYPLDPEHAWNRDLPPDQPAARLARIEAYIDAGGASRHPD